jgi:4-hydroxybenzoate polyprenyltransferase
MVLMRYCIIQPILGTYKLLLEFPFLYFLGLVMSVILIAASGYLINDYFDIQADTVNRPDKVVIGKYIKTDVAYKIYYVMNFCAFGISLYISYKINNISLFVIFPVTAGLLWFYSTTYKRQFLIGNILISLIVASVPYLVVLFDITPVLKNNHEYLMAYNLNFSVIFTWIGAFALFAFLVNLVREFIKDAEDFAGDMLYGRNTLPIVMGLKWTKIIISGLTTFIIIGLGWIFFKYLGYTYVYDSTGNEAERHFDFITFLYFLLLIITPLVILIYIILIATDKQKYTLASKILKLVMITGVMFAVIVRLKFS